MIYTALESMVGEFVPRAPQQSARATRGGPASGPLPGCGARAVVACGKEKVWGEGQGKQ